MSVLASVAEMNSKRNGKSMVATKTQFDGEKILLPDNLRGLPPQEVIVLYETEESVLNDQGWLKAQEASFAKAWDNDEDSVYDQL